MKRAFTLLAILCALLNSQNTFAKIWRLNNNPGVVADFTDLNSAHQGAASGDTLHLEGSPNGYGSVTFTKKLIVLGPGYFLDENPGSQSFVQTAKVSGITFSMGSQGSIVMGLDFLGAGIAVHTDDIIIRRNKFCAPGNNIPDWTTGAINVHYHSDNSSIPANNIIISQNYGVKIFINNPSTGILITNNYIGVNAWEGDGSGGNALATHANAIILVQNNIFRRGKVIGYNSNFTNNIMYAGFFEGTGNLYSNNICNGTQFGTANGNQSNIVMTNVFVGAGTGVSTDGQWKLKAGSPALGAGYGSTGPNPIDAGMYGGQSAYILAGMPPMPAIYSFEVQPIGSNSDPIDVKVKVKSAGN
jgi:hypothetical protein